MGRQESGGLVSVGYAPSGAARYAPSAYVLGRSPRAGWVVRSATAGMAALMLGGLAVYAVGRWQHKRATESERALSDATQADDRGPRHLHQGAALLALSVLADSALEHYRANFANRAMFIAPIVSALTLVASLRNSTHPRKIGAGSAAVLATAALTGAIGTGFHVYNVHKREGGFDWENLLYGAPLGAPAAIGIAGVLGLGARRVMAQDRPGDPLPAHVRSAPALLGFPAGRALGVFASLALLGTSAEMWLQHFRGAFQNPFMYLPVIVPPLAAAVLALSACKPAPQTARVTRTLLRGTAGVGLAGVGFHAYGISRNMGGWRNWSQMLLQGPPLPAPPSFTGVALAGLGALRMIEEGR